MGGLTDVLKQIQKCILRDKLTHTFSTSSDMGSAEILLKGVVLIPFQPYLYLFKIE